MGPKTGNNTGDSFFLPFNLCSEMLLLIHILLGTTLAGKVGTINTTVTVP